MPFRVTCPACQTACAVPDEALGQKVRCKQCSNVFQIAAAKKKASGPPPAPPPRTSPRAAARVEVPEPALEDVPIRLEEVDDPPSDGLQTAPRSRPTAKKKNPAAKATRPRVRAVEREDPPRSRATFWAIGAAVALLLIGGGIGLAVFLSDKDKDEAPTTTQLADAGNGNKDKGDNGAKKSEGGGDKKPEDRGGDQKPADKIPEVKIPGDKKPEEKKPEEKKPEAKVPGEDIKPADKVPQEEAPPPPPPAVEEKPTVLEQDKVVRTLPSPASAAVVGGGGRYIILHLPQLRKLAVFDVSAAKVKGFVPAAADHIKFAAGKDKLFVALPDANILQRWNLHTLEREVAVPLPGTGKLYHLALGSASQGPLLIAQGEQFRVSTSFLDIRTLKPLNVRNDRGDVPGIGPDTFLRVSADGRVFGMWTPNLSPQGVRVWVLAGEELQVHGNGESSGHVMPGPDGKVIYTGRGLYTNQVKRIGKVDVRSGVFSLPAVQGNFALSVTPPTLNLHFAGETRSLLTLKDIELPKTINQWGREAFGADRRIFLIPSAKVLITIPETNDRLVLHRFDLDAALDKSGVDYLFVMSEPPSEARKGTLLSYQVKVKAKQGGLKYKLDSGPKGMTVSPAGLLRWQVPADFAEPETDVILSVADKTGQEIFHTFKLSIVAKAALPPGPADPLVKEPPVKDPPTEPLVKEPAKDPLMKDPDSRTEEPSGSGVKGIKPPMLDKDVVERTLPSPASSVVVGGGGRYLILHLPREQKLAIFDANEGKITRYVPAADDGVLFAAGLEKLLVVLPSTHIIQRWNLATGKREVAAKFPIKGVVRRLCMGSASYGPLLVGGEDERVTGGAAFLDIRTLKPILYRIQAVGRGSVGFDAGTFIRVSADGKVFGFWRPNLSPQGITTLVLTGGEGRVYSDHISVGHVVPGPDGKILYTARGTYTSQVKAIGNSGTRDGVYSLPAAHGDYCMTLKINGVGGLRTRSVVSVHLAGDQRPLATLPEVELPATVNQWDREPLSTDMRLHLIPAAKLLVTLAPTNDKLVLHRFDPEAALEKSGINYLIVTSKSPPSARRGRLYSYQIAARAKKGGLKYKIESGPRGMTVSPQGRVKWVAPLNQALGATEVIVSLTDADGQERFHSFTLTVRR